MDNEIWEECKIYSCIPLTLPNGDVWEHVGLLEIQKPARFFANFKTWCEMDAARNGTTILNLQPGMMVWRRDSDGCISKYNPNK